MKKARMIRSSMCRTVASASPQSAGWLTELAVFLPSRYTSPESMRWQYLPMKSDACFPSAITSPTISVDDLLLDRVVRRVFAFCIAMSWIRFSGVRSDHYAAYAELCYGSRCASQTLSGHRGFTGIGTSSPKPKSHKGVLITVALDTDILNSSQA